MDVFILGTHQGVNVLKEGVLAMWGYDHPEKISPDEVLILLGTCKLWQMK
jgi:hypothetical protein